VVDGYKPEAVRRSASSPVTKCETGRRQPGWSPSPLVTPPCGLACSRAPRNLSAALAAEFRMLEISASVLEAAAELPRHHSDPFDRVLIAHALQDGLRILTRDAAFAEYGVRRVA
jgi:hypothetical protein